MVWKKIISKFFTLSIIIHVLAGSEHDVTRKTKKMIDVVVEKINQNALESVVALESQSGEIVALRNRRDTSSLSVMLGGDSGTDTGTDTADAGSGNDDECLLGIHDCHPDALCTDTFKSFNCTCKNGYAGNGTFCEDVDECLNVDICHSNGSCNNTIGSYMCYCNNGYTENGTSCTDIDECLVNSDGCQQNCNNTDGSYICSCREGFSGMGKECHDVNECLMNAFLCHVNGNCQNTLGTYECYCNDGFNGDGKNCTDKDECQDLSICSTNTRCTNTAGSYYCACIPGFNYEDAASCVAEDIYIIELRTEEPYHPNYSDPSSDEYKHMKQRIVDAIQDAFKVNVPTVNVTRFANFTTGIVVARVELRFKDPELLPLETIRLLIQNGRLGGILLRKDAIKIVQGKSCLFDAPCSLNATCSDLEDGQYNCTCKDGFVGDGTFCEGFVEVNAEILIKEEFKEELNNQSSPEYVELKNEITVQLTGVFHNIENFKEIKVLGLRRGEDGKTKVDFVVVYRSKSPTTKKEEVKEVAKVLDVEVSKGKIGTIQVETQNLEIKEPPPPPTEVSYENVKESEILVKWKQPNLFEKFKVTLCLITYRELDKSGAKTVRVEPTESNVLLENLESDTFYEIFVRCQNKYGDGENSASIQVKTKKTEESKSNTTVIAAVVVVVLVVFGLCLTIGCIAARRKRNPRRNISPTLETEGNEETSDVQLPYSARPHPESWGRSPTYLQNSSAGSEMAHLSEIYYADEDDELR